MLGPSFHVAVLVEDIDHAVERYGHTLGQQFNEPSTLALDVRAGDGRTERIETRVTYSRVGPPYTELVEATGTGLFAASQGLGLHHVGYWAPTATDVPAALAAQGVGIEWEVVGTSGAVFASFTAPQGLGGVRLELIDESRRSGLEAWFAGGPHPGHG